MATQKSQISTLNTLRKDIGSHDLSAEPRKTLAAIDARYSLSSSRVAMSGLRKEYPDNKVFLDEMKARMVKWKKIDSSQEPTESQKDKYVSWDNIIKFRDQYYNEMTPVQRLLMALYTMVPPVRLDYTPMKIVSRKPIKLEDGMNYYVRSKSPYFLFHSYKTHVKHGDKITKVPKKLQEEINKAVPETQTYLLQDEEGKPWAEPRLSQNVTRIFKQFHDLNTGVAMLRHAYATKFHKGQLPLKTIKKTADAMLHTPFQSMSYRFISLEND